MIFGSVEIKPGVLHTHYGSYSLPTGTNVFARRPFRETGIAIATLLSAFGFSFRALLYVSELTILTGLTGLCLLLGFGLAQLVVANSNLRGSDLTIATWGTYRHLNYLRKQAADAVGGKNEGD